MEVLLSESEVNRIAMRVVEMLMPQVNAALESNTHDRLISRSDAAKMLGVSTWTIWKWMKDGKLTRLKTGSTVRVSEKQVKELMKAI